MIIGFTTMKGNKLKRNIINPIVEITQILILEFE
jgi:hypothetical protein